MYNEQGAAASHGAPHDEDYDDLSGGGLRSRFGRWVGHLTGRSEDEEDGAAGYDESARTSGAQHHARVYSTPSPVGSVSASPAPSGAKASTFRIASARESSISVMPVSTFADVQKAADRLKAGEPQIINLEKTDAGTAERLIDFLNGVTYALDGYVEKVAEGAYLFTPSHIAIHADKPGTDTEAATAATTAAQTVGRAKNAFFDRIS